MRLPLSRLFPLNRLFLLNRLQPMLSVSRKLRRNQRRPLLPPLSTLRSLSKWRPVTAVRPPE